MKKEIAAETCFLERRCVQLRRTLPSRRSYARRRARVTKLIRYVRELLELEGVQLPGKSRRHWNTQSECKVVVL